MSYDEMNLAFYALQSNTVDEVDERAEGDIGRTGHLAMWEEGRIVEGPKPGVMGYVHPLYGTDENPPADLDQDNIYFRTKARYVNEGRIAVAGWAETEQFNVNNNILLGWNGWGTAIKNETTNEIVSLDPRGGNSFYSEMSANTLQGETVTQQILPTAIDKYRVSQVNQYSFVTHQVNKFDGMESPGSTRDHKFDGISSDGIFSAPLHSGNDWVLFKVAHDIDGVSYTELVMFKPTGGANGTAYTVYFGLDTNGAFTAYALKNMISVKIGADIYFVDVDKLVKHTEGVDLSPLAYTIVDTTPEAIEGEPAPEKTTEIQLKDFAIAGIKMESAVGPENACAYGHGIFGYKDIAGGWSVRYADGEVVNLPTANGIYWAGNFPMLCARIDNFVQIWPLAPDNKSVQMNMAIFDAYRIYQTSIGLYAFTKETEEVSLVGDYLTGVFSNDRGVTTHSYGQTGLFLGPRALIGVGVVSTPANNGEQPPSQKGYGWNHKPDSAVFLRKVSPTEYSLNAMGHTVNEVIEINELEEGSLNQMLYDIANNQMEFMFLSSIAAKFTVYGGALT